MPNTKIISLPLPRLESAGRNTPTSVLLLKQRLSVPEDSKYKLHHPNWKTGIKRKSSSEGKNVRGRYFDSWPFDVAETEQL
ncbi:Hypothetical predicted protein [Olea europaea subsp. europaea]|uniref:Uncharacterized protein n=1 Tax=Olea europaea subsp. europaea TaxID=158383 RepID=A0A8S0U5H8_OLEEU|nr:Hypothetical predicted protein [Olea europaea subsp. europaea]